MLQKSLDEERARHKSQIKDLEKSALSKSDDSPSDFGAAERANYEEQIATLSRQKEEIENERERQKNNRKA